MTHATLDKLVMLLKPTAEGLGYEWYGSDFVSEAAGGVLRIYLNKAGGITIDDCVKASQQFVAVLQVEDLHKAYRIEVSSPGLDRPLLTLDHWQGIIGQEVKIKLKRPLLERKQYRGVVKKVDENEVVLNEATEQRVIPFAYINKANLVPVIDFKRNKARQ